MGIRNIKKQLTGQEYFIGLCVQKSVELAILNTLDELLAFAEGL